MTFEKTNHHYVPQFWQKKFRDANKQLFGRVGSKIKLYSPKRIMNSDWAYTIFDSHWIPSDKLEDALSIEEGIAAPFIERLCDPGIIPTVDDRNGLCDFLALQSCRHPDIMGRAFRRSKDLANVLAAAHQFVSDEDFSIALMNFGVPSGDAKEMYRILKSTAVSQLAAELEVVLSLSPQDARFAQQEALLSQPYMANFLRSMNLTLLDAPSGSCFILGDTPVPQMDMSNGFMVPLSKSVAVQIEPATSPQTLIPRRNATIAEVRQSNQMQWDSTALIVIGPDRAVLAALV